jgi:hypothetical protein
MADAVAVLVPRRHGKIDAASRIIAGFVVAQNKDTKIQIYGFTERQGNDLLSSIMYL